jgi:hypothetical protein
MAVEWIEHNGKKILYGNFTDCKTKEDMIKNIENLAEECRKASGKVLILDNFEGTYASEEFIKKSDKLAKEVFNDKREKAAIIGIKGFKKIFLNSYNAIAGNELKLFDTKEEALDYLTK